MQAGKPAVAIGLRVDLDRDSCGSQLGCEFVCAATPSWVRLAMKLDPKANNRIRSNWRL